MLRTGYIVFIHEFLIPYLERTSLRTSERYGIKTSDKNDIRLLTCNNLFITYYMLKTKSCHQVEVQEIQYKVSRNLEAVISLEKTRKQFFPPNLHTRRQLKYNRQPDWPNQIITVYLTGQFKP